MTGRYRAGDLVEVWDQDVRKWLSGRVESVGPIGPSPEDCYVVALDHPDPLTAEAFTTLSPEAQDALDRGLKVRLLAIPVSASAGLIHRIG